MATPIWSITNLERKLPDGTTAPAGQVYTAHWAVSLEDQGETAGAYGSVGFSDPEGGQYTPFDQLTEAQVLEWVFDILGVDQIVSIQEALYRQIQEKLKPTHASGVPW